MWVEGGEELGPPPYAETVDVGSSSVGDEEGSVDASEISPVSPEEEDGDFDEEGARAGEAGGDGLFDSSSSWNPAHRPS